MSTNISGSTEPKGSERSSLDDLCARCGCKRSYHHDKFGCNGCAIKMRGSDSIHAFVPAHAETAGEPERPDLDCVRPTGCRDLLKRGCAHGCAEAADELTRLGEEMAPETPEHEHDWSEWGSTYHGGHMRWRECQTCRAREGTKVGHECPECTPEPEAPECTCQSGTWDKFDSPKDCLVHGSAVAQPPRRPPYAVAYAIEGGAQYEIALPGDAAVRAVDGALVITHDKPVLAMGQVRPMEGA